MNIEFKYKFSENKIIFKLFEDTNEVWMEDVNIDYDNIKIFFLLLKNAFDKFTEMGYKIFVQTVLKEDWEYIKKYNWTIKENIADSPTIIILCNIEDAIYNITSGLGFE